MLYFLFFALLLITTIVAIAKDDVDLTILLLILDIFFLFVSKNS